MATLRFRRACWGWMGVNHVTRVFDIKLTTSFTAIAVGAVRHALTFFLMAWTKAVRNFTSRRISAASVVGFDGRKPETNFKVNDFFEKSKTHLVEATGSLVSRVRLAWVSESCRTGCFSLAASESSGKDLEWSLPWNRPETNRESAFHSWKRTQDMPRRAVFCARQILLVWLTFYCMPCLKFKASKWVTVTCGFERLLNALNRCSHHVAVIVVLEKQIKHGITVDLTSKLRKWENRIRDWRFGKFCAIHAIVSTQTLECYGAGKFLPITKAFQRWKTLAGVSGKAAGKFRSAIMRSLEAKCLQRIINCRISLKRFLKYPVRLPPKYLFTVTAAV